MIKGVIFDMDGLMFDTERLSTVMWGKAGAEQGVTVTKEFVDICRGKNSEDIRKIFLNAFGETFDYDTARAKRHQYMWEYMEANGVPKKDGLVELLTFLRDNQIGVAVATSTGREMAKKMLKMAGVYEYVNAFAFGDEVVRSKPEPEIFIKAAHALGLESEDCVVLEDSGPGVIAGKAAGGSVIHIPDMVVLSDEIKEGITKEVKSLNDVIIWLKEENKID